MRILSSRQVVTGHARRGGPRFNKWSPFADRGNSPGSGFRGIGKHTKTLPVTYLVTRKEITKIEQLKGKTLGVSRVGDALHGYLGLALTKLGIDPKDVTFVTTGHDPVRAASVKAGSTDATILPIEFASGVEGLGLHVLMDLRKLDIEYLGSDMITSRSFIRRYEDVVRRYVKSIVEGVHFFVTNKDRSMEIMAKYIGVSDPKIVEAGYNYFAESYQKKPYVAIRGVETVLATPCFMSVILNYTVVSQL